MIDLGKKPERIIAERHWKDLGFRIVDIVIGSFNFMLYNASAKD